MWVPFVLTVFVAGLVSLAVLLLLQDVHSTRRIQVIPSITFRFAWGVGFSIYARSIIHIVEPRERGDEKLYQSFPANPRLLLRIMCVIICFFINERIKKCFLL